MSDLHGEVAELLETWRARAAIQFSAQAGITERCARELTELLERHPPQPADQIPWGEYPWAKWAAADPDGTVNVYDAKPYCDPKSNTLIDQWWEHELEGMEWVEVQGIIHGPWRESLRKRPEGV